jgi:hypothetical protein
VTLNTVFARCCISRYDAAQWFSGASLVGSDLLVTNHDDAEVIRRCYLPMFKEKLGLTLRVIVTSQVKPVSAKFAPDPRRVFKKKHWKELGIPDPPKDLLDTEG